MENVIKLLKAKQAEVDAEIAAIDQVRKIVTSNGVDNKRAELRSLDKEIDEALTILSCHREIKLLTALIEDDKLNVPS